jgi:hypothetical protein
MNKSPAQLVEFSIALVLLLTSFALAKEEQKETPWRLSMQYVGFTFHPGGGNAPEIYPLRLDEQAYWVFELGASAGVDYTIFDDKMFARYTMALYKDCAFVPAGYIHLGLRGVIFKNERHEINGGVGPTLLFREDWHQFPEYAGDEFYSRRVYKGWQYRFIFYGGEFDYLYRINDNWEIHYSLIPGVPIIITSKFGLRYTF